MKIVLTGKPQSTNNLYRSRCMNNRPIVYMTTEGKTLKEDYQWQAKAQYKGKPLTENLVVYVELYFPDKRVRDIDNYNKLTIDSLSGIVWVDDKQIKTMTVTKQIDKENPRIELEIEPY